MAEEKKIVEVTVTTDGGKQIPIGIMNAKQALSLPDEMDVAVSHPNREAGTTDALVDRARLQSLTEPSVQPGQMRFPAPKTEDPAARLDEAKAIARDALDELVASANEAGWGTQEITAALIDAAQALKRTNEADPDPAEESVLDDAVCEQIGHGEQFD